MLERMRLVDMMNHWQVSTLQKYGPYLRYLQRFGQKFGVQPLQPTPVIRPSISPAISLTWAELYYSLRTTKGKDGEARRISANTVRQIRSAASLYYSLDMSASLPRQVERANRRSQVSTYVSPCDED